MGLEETNEKKIPGSIYLFKKIKNYYSLYHLTGG